MSKPFLVWGLPGSGKTGLIQGLIWYFGEKGQAAGAFKPFDTGGLAKNAAEVEKDGELFCRLMRQEPNENWINPYLAHESYPVEMAFRRDGIRIDWKHLQQSMTLLRQHYQPLFIEMPGGILTPLEEGKSGLDWALELSFPVIYGLHPDQANLAWQLAELKLLKQTGLELHLWMSNLGPSLDGDYLFFLWEQIEALCERQLEGLLPYQLELHPEGLATSIKEHLPGLLKKIEG